MNLQKQKLLKYFILITITIQTGLGLFQAVTNISKAQIIFIPRFGMSNLLVVIFFLLVIVCLFWLLRCVARNKTIKPGILAKFDKPGFYILLFILLLGLILSSSILYKITDLLITEGRFSKYSIISFENLILQLKPVAAPFTAYLTNFVPLFKWGLAFGLEAIIFLAGCIAFKHTASSGIHPKHYQEIIFFVLVFLLCISLTVIVFFPENQSFILQIDSYPVWIPVMLLVFSVGLLIPLIYCSKKSIQYYVWGLFIIAMIFNLIDHMYTDVRLELSQKPSNSLESFFVTPNENYHFREHMIYQKLSRDYVGKNINISQEIMDEFSLSSVGFVMYGRVAEVNISEEDVMLDEKYEMQLLKMPYSELLILSRDRFKPDDHIWVFIETGLKDASSIQIKRSLDGTTFVYPDDLVLSTDAEAK